MNKECVTCNFLGVCSKTDTKKVLSHFVCELHKEVSKEVVDARCAVINTFGEAGLKAIISPDTSEEA